MTNVISCTLVLILASGVVPLAGVSNSGGSLTAYHLTSVLGPPASYPMPLPPVTAYPVYLPLVIRR